MLGDDAPLDVACELAALDLTVGARMADALVSAGMLESSGQLSLRHPLLRSAITSGVTPFERSSMHGRAASLLRRRGASVERVAMHVLATTAGHDPDGASTLQAAIDRAVERGAPEAAIPLLSRLLQEPLDPDTRTSTLTELGRLEYATGRANRGVEHLQEAYSNATDAVTRARALIPLLQASARGRTQFQELVASNSELIEAVRAADPELALKVQGAELLAHLPGVAPEAIEQAKALKGDTAGEAVVLGYSVFESMDNGAPAAEVADIAERAARQVDALVEDGTTTTAFAGMILGLRWADRLDTAERTLDRAIELARRRGSMLDYANAIGLRAMVRIRMGRLREAEADARSAVAVSGARLPRTRTRPALGHPRPPRPSNSRQGAAGHRHDQVDLLRDAVALLQRSPARLEHARALVDLGAALRRASSRADSRQPLRAGYELAQQCGASGLAETARQELAASGVRVRRKRLSGIDSLTPSERRIAEMAAARASNAEIAQALFVTLKTVEMHLTNVYSKLEIAGRRELTAILNASTPHERHSQSDSGEPPSLLLPDAGR